MKDVSRLEYPTASIKSGKGSCSRYGFFLEDQASKRKLTESDQSKKRLREDIAEE